MFLGLQALGFLKHLKMRNKKILFVSEAPWCSTGYSVYTNQVLKRLCNNNNLDIAQLGIYVEENDPNIKNFPWKIYWNKPKKSNSLYSRYQQSPSAQFGDFMFNEVLLDFMPDIVIDIRDWWMALANPYDVIITPDGYKNVKDIKLGDLVLTHKNRFRKVTHVFNKIYSGNVHKIKASHYPLTLSLTDQHPVLAIRRESENLPNFDVSKPEWIDSHELKEKDIVCIPRYPFNDTCKDSAIFRLYGYYAAEGCIMYEGRKENGKLKGIQLTFNTDEIEFVNDAMKLIKEYFNKDATVKNKSDGSCVISAYGKDIAKSMMSICPGTAISKSLKSTILNTSYSNTVNFLCGLFRGDGCTNTESNRSSYTTSSKSLALQVFQLCVNIGILPSCGYNKNKIGNKVFYRYIFNFNDKAHDAFNIIYKKSNENIPLSNRINEQYAHLTIRTISTREEKDIPVYNFEVEEDNTYVSSFCVHNCEFEQRSPFRNFYKWAIMPTVDAAPQNNQWISTYESADALFAYSEFGRDTLRSQCDNINFIDVASPSASGVFVPVLDKGKHKEDHGVGKDSFIIGTVMRNQKRKLYPDLFKSFRMFLDSSQDQNTFLYCHTYYPDIGWDIPNLLDEYSLSNRVLFTYKCKTCGKISTDFFQDSLQFCKSCGSFSNQLVGINNSINEKELSDIYNMFDIYVQYANSEGFGMPQLEAAFCGLPIISIYYSAMKSIIDNIGGFGINPIAFSRECETGCDRAIPNNDAFVRTLKELRSIPIEKLRSIGVQMMKKARKKYNWDTAANMWLNYINSQEIIDENLTWRSPPNIKIPATSIPIELKSITEKVNFIFTNVLHKPELIHTFFWKKVVRDCTYGYRCDNVEPDFYFNESHLQSYNSYKSFSIDDAFKELYNYRQQINTWEEARQRKISQQ